MLNQRRNFMIGDEPKHLIAVVDTVRFASRDNPITEIKLRTGRGGSLKNSLTDIEEQEEDTGLPVIIGGTNASGKTSLLRGIQEVCNLLQLSTITKKDSQKCRQAIQDMGIRYLELEFVVELGRSNSDKILNAALGYMPGQGRLDDLVRIEAITFGEDRGIITSARFAPEIDSQPLLLENVLSVKFDSSDGADGLTWCDGMRLRRAGHTKSLDKMYHRYGGLSETKQRPGPFRNIKRDDALKLFLEDSKGLDIGGLTIGNFHLNQKTDQRRYPVMFQPATLIEVNRNQSDLLKKQGQLRTLIPSLSNQFKAWRENPELLRKTLSDLKEGNQLFTLLGLKSSDIFFQEKGHPEWLFLHDSAPDIVESMMLKPDWVNGYTWYSEFAWRSSQKQRGIDVVMEGVLHDIVRFVAGGKAPPRVLVGKSTGVENRYGDTFDVEWTDWNEERYASLLDKKKTFLWGGPNDRDFLDCRKMPHIPISEILRELPWLAEFVGMEKDEADLLDVLVRFNAFTPLEKIDQPYLSSGQEQVLALIISVRGAKEGSLILVDEPEISLHIDWQEQLVERLYAPLTGSRLIIATHSPDIVVQHRHLCTVINSKEEGKFYRIE